jgi:hypothetical protein
MIFAVVLLWWLLLLLLLLLLPSKVASLDCVIAPTYGSM